MSSIEQTELRQAIIEKLVTKETLPYVDEIMEMIVSRDKELERSLIDDIGTPGEHSCYVCYDANKRERARCWEEKLLSRKAELQKESS